MEYILGSMIDMGLTEEEIQKYRNMDRHIINKAVSDVIRDTTSEKTYIGQLCHEVALDKVNKQMTAIIHDQLIAMLEAYWRIYTTDYCVNLRAKYKMSDTAIKQCRNFELLSIIS